MEEEGDDSKAEWEEEVHSEIGDMTMDGIEIIEIEAEEEVEVVTEAGKGKEAETETEIGEEIEGIEIGTEIDIEGTELKREALEIEVIETGIEVIGIEKEIGEIEVIETEIEVIGTEWTEIEIEKGIGETEIEVRETEAKKEDICIWIEMIEIKYNLLKIDIIGCNFIK